MTWRTRRRMNLITAMAGLASAKAAARCRVANENGIE
jgi:hypothetical protein